MLTFSKCFRDDETVSLHTKKEQYFAGVQQLMHVIDNTETCDFIIYVVMICNMIRIIQATNLHPRLALLTGTIGYAAQALMHAALVATVVFLGFAFIGVWRFGYIREEYVDLHTAMATQVSIVVIVLYYYWNSPLLLL